MVGAAQSDPASHPGASKRHGPQALTLRIWLSPDWKGMWKYLQTFGSSAHARMRRSVKYLGCTNQHARRVPGKCQESARRVPFSEAHEAAVGLPLVLQQQGIWLLSMPLLHQMRRQCFCKVTRERAPYMGGCKADSLNAGHVVDVVQEVRERPQAPPRAVGSRPREISAVCIDVLAQQGHLLVPARRVGQTQERGDTSSRQSFPSGIQPIDSVT